MSGDAAHNADTRAVVHVTDYGLGTYNDSPLVLVLTSGRGRYHRRAHSGRFIGTTWTEDFARHGLELEPCRICWHQPPLDIDGSGDE